MSIDATVRSRRLSSVRARGSPTTLKRSSPLRQPVKLARSKVTTSVVVGSIERLPKWLLCIPLVTQWLWLGLKYRSVTLPSVVNPAIANGGLAGESKLACLNCIGAEHAEMVARTVAVRPGDDADAVRRGAGLLFPLIVKPDIGWCGYGVRRVDDAKQLTAYAKAFPAVATYLVQEFIDAPGEAGLFYVRKPDAIAGQVVAVALRHQPQVVGDGVQRVWQLAAADRRLAGRDIPEATAMRLPEAGEVVLLATVASLRVGGRYEDGARLVSAALSARVDRIACSMGGFTFGRLDVKFDTDGDLQAGQFRIIEVNGAGSEAIQYWDPATPMVHAFAGIFNKQSELFALADRWRAQGRRPVGIVRLAQAWLTQQRLISRYPPSN